MAKGTMVMEDIELFNSRTFKIVSDEIRLVDCRKEYPSEWTHFEPIVSMLKRGRGHLQVARSQLPVAVAESLTIHESRRNLRESIEIFKKCFPEEKTLYTVDLKQFSEFKHTYLNAYSVAEEILTHAHILPALREKGDTPNNVNKARYSRNIYPITYNYFVIFLVLVLVHHGFKSFKKALGFIAFFFCIHNNISNV
ncbi:hypothetical protein BD770DRAFT_427777 [Pilaira anomala]|nr:hypothetical protein BD770DRAFT_427777 [Pilaira anomala]